MASWIYPDISSTHPDINKYCIMTLQSFPKKKKKLFVAFPWVGTSTVPGGFMICVFII